MKNLLPLRFIVPCAALFATASMSGRGTMMLGTTEFSVDTVFHAKVGPGTTHTQLALRGSVYLDLHYITTDITTPGVSIRSLSGADKVAGNGRTSTMAQNHTKPGLHYFGGSNGDFYFTGGVATNGSSIVGTPVCASTIDGEVFRTSASSYQFSVDVDGRARICRLDYTKGTATIGDNTVPFKAVNNDAPNNGVTLYTSKYWGSPNQGGLAGACAEVSAKLVEGDTFTAGLSYRLEVTSEPSSTGDLTIPTDGFVILGRGTGKSFVESLKPGDVVTFDNVTLTPEGEKIVPSCVISGNPKNIGGGVNLNSEAERGDASQRHPRTGIGVSADGTKIVMMVCDGRGVSAGCSTGWLGDMLLYAGCAEGVNLDGGGSSTLYTEALGVRNRCSDGSERSVSNAIYAVLEAPEDSEVAEITFMDFGPTLPHMGMYTPTVMAFNKYGLCIDTDYKKYTLSCPAELGEIVNDGHTLYITGEGFHALTAHVGDLTATVPIRVDNASEATLTYDHVLIDEDHPYQIRLCSTVGRNVLPLNPRAFSWTSADASVATVNADGIITAVADGTTTIIGTLGELTLEQNITVENPRKAAEAIFASAPIAEWSTAGTGIKDYTVAPCADGIALDYTVSSTRGTKMTVYTNQTIYGIPEALHITAMPGTANISKLTLNLRPANDAQNTSVAFESIPTGETTELRAAFADYFDTTDAGIWPMQLISIIATIGDANKSVSHVELPVFEAVYTGADGVTDAVMADTSLQFAVDGTTITLAEPAAAITLTDIDGRIVATSTGCAITAPAPGLYILTAHGQSAKVVIKSSLTNKY